MQAFGVFGLCQIHGFVDYLRSKLTESQFSLLFRTLFILVGVLALSVGGALTALGSILKDMLCVHVFKVGHVSKWKCWEKSMIRVFNH